MDILADLSTLSSFAGTKVPVAPQDSALLVVCGRLLTLPSATTIKWEALLDVLKSYFEPVEHTRLVVDAHKIYSGWAGVSLLVAAFRRLERFDPKDGHNVEEWLRALRVAVIERSLAFTDPAQSGVLGQVMQNLSTPVQVDPMPSSSRFSTLPQAIPASAPRPQRPSLCSHVSFERNPSVGFHSPIRPTPSSGQPGVDLSSKLAGRAGLSAAKRRKVSGARLAPDALEKEERRFWSASALSSFADYPDHPEEHQAASADEASDSEPEEMDSDADSDLQSTTSSVPTSTFSQSRSRTTSHAKTPSLSSLDFLSQASIAAQSAKVHAQGLLPRPDAPPRLPVTVSQSASIREGKTRPNVSYAALVGQAILSTPEKRMRLCDLYLWISTNYPYYKLADKGWQNSVRHNLSLQPSFIKFANNTGGKGAFWSIKPDDEHRFVDGGFVKEVAKPKTKRAASEGKVVPPAAAAAAASKALDNGSGGVKTVGVMRPSLGEATNVFGKRPRVEEKKDGLSGREGKRLAVVDYVSDEDDLL